MAISPHFRTDDFPDLRKLSAEAKIAIFADRMWGWQLDVAERLSANSTELHAGFAVLAIVFSYIESIGKYELGETSTSDSERHFKSGLASVFPSNDWQKEPEASIATLFYRQARSSIYHSGFTGENVTLGKSEAVASFVDGQLRLDPSQLPGHLQRHFARYIARLLDPGEDSLRARFLKRFDHVTGTSHEPLAAGGSG
jgi:hypothetical protein